MKNSRNDNEPRCSFCGKKRNEVGQLIMGPGVYICDECTRAAYTLTNPASTLEPAPAPEAAHKEITELPTPSKIKLFLDDYVIGQESAKKRIAVAVYNHYKRIFCAEKKDDSVELSKSNIFLIGPTGSGKTLIAQTLARLLNVPFAIADATALTEAGYVGEDVENILTALVQNAKGDVKKAEKGIIYVDEIDKIARKGDNPSITRDVSGEGVQQALLKIIEGTVSNIPPQGGRKHPHQEFLKVDTTNILFIVGGAFIGLDKIVARRLGSATVGFNSSHTVVNRDDIGYLYSLLQPEDLIQFGMIPEFVGRVPIMATLHDLKEEEMVKILTEPKNAIIKQYQKLFRMEKVDLKFERGALAFIAREALKRKVGARGLRGIIEDVMNDVMFYLPDSRGLESFTITEAMVKEKKRLFQEFKKAAGL